MTTLAGIVVIVSDISAFIAKFMGENTAPVSIPEWLAYVAGLAMGVGLIVAKQWNVSNAPQPAPAAVVPPTVSK